MASGTFDPDKLAKSTFILTMLGVVAFVGAVILFVL
jgi:hypothetical protein